MLILHGVQGVHGTSAERKIYQTEEQGNET
jgi:hypothetical protein